MHKNELFATMSVFLSGSNPGQRSRARGQCVTMKRQITLPGKGKNGYNNAAADKIARGRTHKTRTHRVATGQKKVRKNKVRRVASNRKPQKNTNPKNKNAHRIASRGNTFGKKANQGNRRFTSWLRHPGKLGGRGYLSKPAVRFYY